MSFPRIIFVTLAAVFFMQSPLYANQVVEHQGEKITLGPRICLECHDDMEKHSHPTLIKYPPEGKESDFAPANSLLDQGIILIDNQLVCITCHDLKNTASGHLVFDNSQSKLCSACHIK